jgi:hypothetical protein
MQCLFFAFDISRVRAFQLNVMYKHPNAIDGCPRTRSSNQILSIFGVHWQFRKAPEGSPRKNEAQKEVLEAMSHRMHVDNSVKLIGKLLFGIEKGTEMLDNVRPAGSPLVDNWDCLKTMVLLLLIQLHLSFLVLT